VSTGVTVTTRRPPLWRRWTIVCGLGETLGMAAAAGTAGLLIATVGEPHDWPSALVVWLGSILGGAVEGFAIALLQFSVLRRWLPGLPRGRWVTATVTVALAGWALGMAPSSLVVWHLDTGTATGTQAQGPPLALMTLAGVGGGLILGAVFGAAQAWALRGHVTHPRRWVTANALGWAAALAVMMTGASLPSEPWPWPRLLAAGAVTGILAGLAIGAITGLFLPSLVDPAPRNGRSWDRAVLWVLRSPAHRLLSGSLADLRYTGRRSGRAFALPVQYAEAGDALVIVPGRPRDKVWWHNLEQPAPVQVGLAGEVRQGHGCVLTARDTGYAGAIQTYRARWPEVSVGAADPVVVVDLAPAVVAGG
jgi:hypothetical protein